jgi:hypothetical protein
LHEGIWQALHSRERRQHKILELNAAWRNQIAEREMILREIIGEVVEKDQ